MPPREIHSPCDLHDRVHSTLRQDASSFARNVSFQLHNAEVVLDGVVSSYYHKQMAQESLRHIDGLRRVTNRIRVVVQEA